MCKHMNSGSFENVTNKLLVYKSCICYMSQQNFTLNNLQGLICHKTQPTNKSYIFNKYICIKMNWHLITYKVTIKPINQPANYSMRVFW